jgi:hypothetical protein
VILNKFLREYEVQIDLSKDLNGDWNAEEVKKGEEEFGRIVDDNLASDGGLVSVKKYVMMVERVVRRESKVIDVLVDDLERWRREVEKTGNWAPLEIESYQDAREMAEKIENNTMRYMALLEEVIDEMVKEEREKEETRRKSRVRGDKGTQGSQSMEVVEGSQREGGGGGGIGGRRREEDMWADENAELIEEGEGTGEENANERRRKVKVVQANLRRR